MISRPLLVFARHTGIVIQAGTTPYDILVMTVYEGKKAPVIENLMEFSKGMPIKVLPYRSKFSRQQTVFNAINIRAFEYNLFTNNCESFCRRVWGLNNVSQQVLFLGYGALCISAYALASKR